MARRLIGVDVGATSVRAAEVALSPLPTLVRYGQVALPPGAVLEGQVIDRDVVAGALRDLWRSVRFSSKRVVLGVGSQRVVVRQADLLWMPPKELAKSLPMLVQDFVPMPVDEAELDFVSVAEITGSDGARLVRGMLVAAGRESVTNLADAVMAAGLRPAAIDATPFALIRALVRLDPTGLTPTRPEALVDIGADVTTIVVHDGGSPRFVRFIALGAKSVSVALEDAFAISPADAEAWKRSVGMVADDTAAEDTQRVVAVAAAAANRILEEVRGSVDFYQASMGAAPVSRVLVTGGGAQMPGLVPRLSALLRLPVEPGHVLERVTVGSTGLTPEQLAVVGDTAAIAIGLGMWNRDE